MTNNKKAHGSCSYRTPKPSVHTRKDSAILSQQYERGTRWAGWLLVGMFVVLSIGSWWLGW